VIDRDRLDVVARQVAVHVAETGLALGELAEVIGRSVDEANVASQAGLSELAELQTRARSVQVTIETEVGGALTSLSAGREHLEQLNRRVVLQIRSIDRVRATVDGQIQSFSNNLRFVLALMTVAIAVGVVGQLLHR